MKRSQQVLALMAMATLLLTASGCSVKDRLLARDSLNKGVQAFKGQHYEEAVNRFQHALELDPTLTNARLYLATALAQQYTPGADAADNTKFATQAVDEYKKVLDAEPNNLPAVKGVAYLYLQMKSFEDAKKSYRRAAELDPNDPETYYSIAVIDWTQTYKPRNDLKRKLNIDAKDPIRDKKACAALKVTSEPIVDDAIASLEKSLQFRPDYDDAMAYMNLMYRERADLQCEDSKARDADLKTADNWVDKTLATKKAKAEKQQGPGGIVMDSSGNMK